MKHFAYIHSSCCRKFRLVLHKTFKQTALFWIKQFFFIFWTKNRSLFCIFPFVAQSCIEQQHEKSTTQLVKAETNKNFPNSTKSLASLSSSSFLGGKAAVKRDIISGVTPTCNIKSAQIVKHIYMSNLGQ